MTRTGVDIARAFALLNQAGWTQDRIATELGVPVRSVRRWAAGHLPPARALTALRGLIDGLAMVENSRKRLTATAGLLAMAVDALKLDAERAEEDRLAAEVRAHMEAGRQRRARHAQRVDRLRTARQRTPVTSVTNGIDPFLLAGGQPYQEVFAS